MIYSYKNIDVNLSKMKVTGVSGIPVVTKSQEYFCQNLSLQSSTTLDPSYLLYGKFVENYAPRGGINGGLSISYYLTGEDLIRDFFSDDSSDISGNIGGLFFQKGKVSSYSLSAKPNSPIIVNAEISFFNELSGSFKPVFKEAPSVDVFSYYNTSFENLSPEVIGSDAIIFNFDYSFKNEINPVYKIDSGVGQVAPTEINIGRKSCTLKLNTDRITGKMPFSGQKAGVRIGLRNFTGALVDTFHISGIITEKSISTSENQIINSEITIRQLNSSKSIPSVASADYSEYGSSTLITVYGSNLDEIYTLRIGDVFYHLVEPFLSTENYISRFKNTNETAFTKRIGSGGETEIVILAPGFHSAGDILTLVGNGAGVSVPYVNWTTSTPLVSGAVPNPQVIGSPIQISGANFFGITQVFLGNSEITSFDQVGSEFLNNCIIPENAESGIIRVVRNNITGSGAFAFYPYPKITGLNLYTGIVGQNIEILGAAFNHVTGVRFNKTLSSSFTVDSNSKITATIPSGNIQGAISVSGYTGTFFTSKFVFEAIPVITGQSPETGVTGKAIRLLGTGIIPEILYSPNNDNRFLVRFKGSDATGLFNFVSDASSNYFGSLTGLLPQRARKGDLRIIKNVDGEDYASSFNFKMSGVDFDLISTSPKTGSVSFFSKGVSLSEITGVTLKNTITNQKFIIPSGRRVGFEISELSQLDDNGEPFYGMTVNGLTGTGFGFVGLPDSGKLVEGLYNIILSDSSNLSKEFSQVNVNTFYFATKPELSGFSPLTGVFGDFVSLYGTGLYNGTQVRINTPGQSNLLGASLSGNSRYTYSQFQINGGTLLENFFSDRLPPVEFVTGFLTFKNNFSSETATGNSLNIVPFKLIGPPYISGFTPTSGSFNDTIIVSGLGFINVSSLKLSNNNKSIDSFNVVGTTGINFKITNQMVKSGAGGGFLILQATGGLVISNTSLALLSPVPIGSGFSPQPAVASLKVVLTGSNLDSVRQLSFSGINGSEKHIFVGDSLGVGNFTVHHDPTFSTGEYHIKFISPSQVSGDKLVKLTSVSNGVSYTLVTFKNEVGLLFGVSGIFLSDNLTSIPDVMFRGTFTGVSGDVFGISGSGFLTSNAKVFFGTGTDSSKFLAPVQSIKTDSLITGRMENGLNERIFVSGYRDGVSLVNALDPLILFPQILGLSKTGFVEDDSFKVTGINTFSLSGVSTQTGNFTSRYSTNVRLAITGLRYGSSVPEVEFLNYNISGFELSKGNLNFSGQINSEFAGTGRVFLISLSDTGSVGPVKYAGLATNTSYYLTYNSGNLFKDGFTKNYLSGKILSTFNTTVTINEKQATISGFSPRIGQLESTVIVTGTSLRAITGVSLFSGLTESASSVPFGYECLFYDVEKPINFSRIKFTVPADFTQSSGRLRFRSKNYTTDTSDFFRILSESSSTIFPTGGVAGDVITLNGSTFSSTSRVDFVSLDNEIVSGKFTIVNDTQITVTVPIEGRLTAPQVVSIKITNDDGSINLGNFDVRQGSENFFGNIQASGFISGLNFLGTGLGGRPTVNGSGVRLVGEVFGNIQATGFISGFNFLGTGLGGRPTVNGSGVLLVGETFGNIQATGFISGFNFLGTGLGGRPTVNGSGVLLVGEAAAGGGGNITITGGLDTSSASQIFTGNGVQVLFGLNSGIHSGINGSTDQIRATSVLVSLDGLLQDPVQHYTITTHLVGVAYSGLLFASAPVTGTEIEVRRFGDTVTVDFTGGGGGGISANQAIIYALVFG